MRILYVVRKFKSMLIALICAVSIATLTGCYAGGFKPRETGTVGGAALGAGSGALIGSAVGTPGTGAVIGGLGGGLAGYLVGNSMQERDYRDGYHGNGYYDDGYRGYY
jgi:Glycine zipper